MSRSLGRFSAGLATTATVIGAVAVLAVGTAAATTTADITYQAGSVTPVTYTCTFPGIAPQPVLVTAQLDGPASVPSGTVVTPSNVGGTATISAGVHAILNAVGYNGIRGEASVPVTVDNGTLSQPSADGLNIPEEIYPPSGPITVNISQVATSSIPTLTVGAAGTATLSLGDVLTAALEFHKASTDTWTPFTMSCNVAASQNAAFTPPISIT